MSDQIPLKQTTIQCSEIGDAVLATNSNLVWAIGKKASVLDDRGKAPDRLRAGVQNHQMQPMIFDAETASIDGKETKIWRRSK